MKWVKLLAVKGSGEGRVTKELTIPVEKLDERCQSRVRQIDHLKSKVEAALPRQRKRQTLRNSNRMWLQMVTAGGVTKIRWRTRQKIGRKTSRRSHPRQPVSPQESGSSVDPPRLPDHDPWRTSYEAFRANILRTPEGVLANRESWEGMATLQSLAPETISQRVRFTERGRYRSPRISARGGTVRRRGVCLGSDLGEAWPRRSLGRCLPIAAYVEPFKSISARSRTAGNWQHLRWGIGSLHRPLHRFQRASRVGCGDSLS